MTYFQWPSQPKQTSQSMGFIVCECEKETSSYSNSCDPLAVLEKSHLEHVPLLQKGTNDGIGKWVSTLVQEEDNQEDRHQIHSDMFQCSL